MTSEWLRTKSVNRVFALTLTLKEQTIYISIRFATVSHLCVCGCGNKVVTPLRPTDWKLIFDGKTKFSLDLSIGNWSSACESHYYVQNNRVKMGSSLVKRAD